MRARAAGTRAAGTRAARARTPAQREAPDIVNIEFHYYVLYALALRAGFHDGAARLLAHSSQYVDTSLISYKITSATGSFSTVITQDYGWWDETFPRDVYLPFHFFPGDVEKAAARRADGTRNPLSVTPASPGLKRLLVAALQTRNLYRVGIALHTYADSWAHQDFSGVSEEWNTLDTSLPVPPIGHAQAGTLPDRLAARWDDPRLLASLRRVDNRERQLRAARMIYKYLCTYNRRSFDDVDGVIGELAELLDPSTAGGMEERILNLRIAYGLTPFERQSWLQEAALVPESERVSQSSPGYSKLLWLRDALLYRTTLLRRKRTARPMPRSLLSCSKIWLARRSTGVWFSRR